MQITLGSSIAFACLIPVSVLMFCVGRWYVRSGMSQASTIPEPLQVQIARRECRKYYWPALMLRIVTFASWTAAGAMSHAGSLLAPTNGKLSQMLTSTAFGIVAVTTLLNFRGWLSSYGKTADKIKQLILDWELENITDPKVFGQSLSALTGAHIEAADKTLAETNPSNAPTSVTATASIAVTPKPVKS